MNTNIAKIKYLTKEFYSDYPQSKFPELELKEDRPYIVFLVKIENNTFAIPFRTNIRHNYCYKFKKSGRQTSTVTAIDFTKAVVVNDDKYIGDDATIDKDEFNELDSKLYFVRMKFVKYVENYIKFLKNPNDEKLAKKYKFTTLEYFKDKLDIKK